MKKTILLLGVVFMAISAFASKPLTVNLYPSKAPNQSVVLKETQTIEKRGKDTKALCRVTNVDTPTITFYKASKPNKDNKVMIVCPGGGYNLLSIEAEGSDVCEFLNSVGVHAVLLKYRVPRRKDAEKHIAALEDVQRAISVVRGRAKEFGFNPNKLGVMGFSAGGHLSVMASTSYKTRVYPAYDKYDSEPLRPDFVALIYPAYLVGETPLELAPEVKPTSETPPTFIAHAQDDKKFISSTFAYSYNLKELGVPMSVNIYPEGGHGHGFMKQGVLIDNWPNELALWLKSL